VSSIDLRQTVTVATTPAMEFSPLSEWHEQRYLAARRRFRL